MTPACLPSAELIFHASTHRAIRSQHSSSDKHKSEGSWKPWAVYNKSHQGTEAGLAGGNKAEKVDKNKMLPRMQEGSFLERNVLPQTVDVWDLFLIDKSGNAKFFQAARIISMQGPEALCLEQLFITKKIKMMHCILYSISRDHENHNTWNAALPRPT